MKYVAIHIKTLGLDPKIHQIIELNAIADDLNEQLPIEKLPKFQTYVSYETYSGCAYALAEHAGIFNKISNYNNNGVNICYPETLIGNFNNFLYNKCGYKYGETVNIAGKNFANFDNKFLEKLENYSFIKIHHRIIDPAILYFIPTDTVLPSLEQCVERAGIEIKSTAEMVVQLLRHKFPKNCE